jgi:hypothetical protein
MNLNSLKLTFLESRTYDTLSTLSNSSKLSSPSVISIIRSLKRHWVKASIVIFVIIVYPLYYFGSFLHASSRESVPSNSITNPISFSRIQGKDVVLVTGSNGNHPLNPHEGLIRANRMEYADFHGEHCCTHMLTLGYDFFEANFSEYLVPNVVGPSWFKLPVLVDVFKRYPQAKWVWWLDFDAIIMSPKIDLGSHLLDPDIMYSKLLKGEVVDLPFNLPEDPDVSKINLILSGDSWGPVNGGCLFLRRSEWTDMLLDIWVDPYFTAHDEEWKVTQEQEALVHLMRTHYTIRDHIGIVPPRLINANGVGVREETKWHSNDFVLHFAGCM